MEEELAKHLKQLADQFHDLAPVKCRELAFEYAEKNNIPVPVQISITFWCQKWDCTSGRIWTRRQRLTDHLGKIVSNLNLPIRVRRRDRDPSRIVSVLRSIWIPTSTLPRQEDNNLHNSKLHCKRIFHKQEPKLHHLFYHFLRHLFHHFLHHTTFQTRNPFLHLTPDEADNTDRDRIRPTMFCASRWLKWQDQMGMPYLCTGRGQPAISKQQ
ncbi:unnamed protein product [Pleuronectes platessa]|uniref:Uncharacterized protein n=1 Tax=Pleuronectes platessa TaxID=8262 RepID=A0A9N7V2T1_PLEPL|nr:unnamed protein product [Pleuronectes platessa]